MPKCKINYESSEIREYQNDADKGHKYLSLILEPIEYSLLAQSKLGRNGSKISMVFYPQRDVDGNIDEVFENALIDAFNNKKLGEVYADRVEVEIPPTLMTYSSDTKNHSKGDWIMDGEQPRIITSIKLATLTKMVKGEEVPILSQNELKSQAIAIRNYRIEQEEWYEVSAWQAENNIDEIEEEGDPTIVDPIDVEKPKQGNRPTRR